MYMYQWHNDINVDRETESFTFEMIADRQTDRQTE